MAADLETLNPLEDIELGKVRTKKGFVFSVPDPVVVETEGLGTILLSNWSGAVIIGVSNILEGSVDSPQTFIRRFVEVAARSPNPDADKDRDQFDQGRPINSGEPLTDADLETIAESYIAAKRHEFQYWLTDEPEENRGAYRLAKLDGESQCDYFYRLIQLSTRKANEHTRRLMEQFSSQNLAKNLWGQYANGERRLGALGERMRDIQSSPAVPPDLDDFIARLPPNPSVRTNTLLAAQAGQLEKLLGLVGVGIEQAKILSERSTDFLRDSASSVRHTRFALWVAVCGILLSAIFGAYSISLQIRLDRVSEKLLAEHSAVSSRLVTISDALKNRTPAPQQSSERSDGSASDQPGPE